MEFVIKIFGEDYIGQHKMSYERNAGRRVNTPLGFVRNNTHKFGM
jgi:hypothetical protein